ncbi:MAG TPA: site-2 protease family protein, partial [Bryobacteraceae bacterium]|nr:site-2 protease family protein [Bryobacteraceae bacterium]
MGAFLLNVWWLLVLIGVMILIHELGHFWAARAFDVKVEVFSFGFGPRLFGFRRGETDYRFSLVLFGGYVKMAGEQQPGDRASDQAALEQVDDPRYLNRKPRWQRLIITAAGPFMNVVLAIAVLT